MQRIFHYPVHAKRNWMEVEAVSLSKKLTLEQVSRAEHVSQRHPTRPDAGSFARYCRIRART